MKAELKAALEALAVAMDRYNEATRLFSEDGSLEGSTECARSRDGVVNAAYQIDKIRRPKIYKQTEAL